MKLKIENLQPQCLSQIEEIEDTEAAQVNGGLLTYGFFAPGTAPAWMVAPSTYIPDPIFVPSGTSTTLDKRFYPSLPLSSGKPLSTMPVSSKDPYPTVPLFATLALFGSG